MERKIEIRKGKFITINGLFREKERFHKKLSRMTFEEKIGILMRLREIVGLRKAKRA